MLLDSARASYDESREEINHVQVDLLGSYIQQSFKTGLETEILNTSYLLVQMPISHGFMENRNIAIPHKNDLLYTFK